MDIVIPTLHRPEKLHNCIESIKVAKQYLPDEVLKVSVYYSDMKEFSSAEYSYSTNFHIIPVYIAQYDAASFWNMHLCMNEADMMMYLNDDVILDKYCIRNAYNCMLKHFPDTDGVIGIYQENIPEDQAVKAAFGVIGMKFANRFPQRKVFCEAYHRFYLDKELEEYATSIDKFYFDRESKLIHLHPAFDSTQDDLTHHNVRQYLRKDKETYFERKEKGLLYGQ